MTVVVYIQKQIALRRLYNFFIFYFTYIKLPSYSKHLCTPLQVKCYPSF